MTFDYLSYINKMFVKSVLDNSPVKPPIIIGISNI